MDISDDSSTCRDINSSDEEEINDQGNQYQKWINPFILKSYLRFDFDIPYC